MYAIERGTFRWYECLRGGRKGQFNPLAIRRITTAQASFQSQSVISFWQMELMSFAALLVSFTVAQQKIWTHPPGLSFQSWFELFLVEPLTPHRAPDVSGLSLCCMKRTHTGPFSRYMTCPVWKYHLLCPCLYVSACKSSSTRPHSAPEVLLLVSNVRLSEGL